MGRRTPAGAKALRQRRQLRRDAMVDAAFELFAEEGFTDSGIEEICQTAGVGYRAFYDEFGTKAALYNAVYDTVAASVLGRVIANVPADLSADERPRALVSAYISAATSDPRFGRILFGLSASSDDTIEEHRRNAERNVAGLIAELYRHGDVTDATPSVDDLSRVIGLAMTGAISHLVVDFVMDETRSDPDELIGEAMLFLDIVTRGLASVTE